MLEQYPGQVLLAGVYGSVARKTDTTWSDLDMLFVVTDDCPVKSNHIIYHTIAVSYRVHRKSDYEKILTTASWKWPFHMGILDVLEVLFGDASLVEGWMTLGQTVPLEAFHHFLGRELPTKMVEAYGREPAEPPSF